MRLKNKSEAEILKIATPIMDNLMAGSTECDWHKHTQHFTDGAKSIVTPSKLREQCEYYQSKFGYFAERAYIGMTRHPEYVNILWQQKMTASPGEYLAVLTLIQTAEEYRVARCWVD